MTMQEAPLRRYTIPPERDIQQAAVESHAERMKGVFKQAYEHVEQGLCDFWNHTGQGWPLRKRRELYTAHMPCFVVPDVPAGLFLAYYDDPLWLSRFAGGLLAMHMQTEPPPPEMEMPVSTDDPQQDAEIMAQVQAVEEQWVVEHAAWEEKEQRLLMGDVQPGDVLAPYWGRLWSLDAPWTRKMLREVATMEKNA